MKEDKYVFLSTEMERPVNWNVLSWATRVDWKEKKKIHNLIPQPSIKIAAL